MRFNNEYEFRLKLELFVLVLFYLIGVFGFNKRTIQARSSYHHQL